MQNKTYTACLLPQEDGSYEDIDCGGAEVVLIITKEQDLSTT